MKLKARLCSHAGHMFQGRSHLWFVLPDWTAQHWTLSERAYTLDQLLLSLHHHAMVPSSLWSPWGSWEMCSGNRERNRTLVFTNVCLSFSHCAQQTHHESQSWVLRDDLAWWDEEVWLSHCRQSTLTLCVESPAILVLPPPSTQHVQGTWVLF